MREIKFKAWIPSAEKMRYFDITEYPPMYRDNLIALEGYSLPKGLNVTRLMQYTGLKDKNGKEIYEGDIIRQEWENSNGKHSRICQIIYEAPLFKIDAEEPWYQKDDLENSEVIGNIYENPDLK